VLPIENLSHDNDQDYLSDGMTAELIARLGQNTAVRVISRTSVAQYKGVHRNLAQIAKELGVNAVLEGTVERLGDRVRITAQLVRTDPERVLWAQSFDRSLDDVMPLQEEIAREIANQIRIKLSPERTREQKRAQPVSWEAYEAYLRGISQQGTISGRYRRIQYFEQAIEKQPDYAAAYAGIALAYIGLGHFVNLPPHEAFPKAKVAALRALDLDADLADAHSALGDVQFLYDWDFPSAEKELQKAIELNPNGVLLRIRYCDFLNAMGRPDEVIVETKRIERIDPIWYASSGVAAELYWARRYDDAIELLRKELELAPNSADGRYLLGLSYVQKRQFPQAISEIQKSWQLSHEQIAFGFLAYALAVSGDKPAAERTLKELLQSSPQSYVSSMWPALIYPALGKKKEALFWLQKAYDGHEHDLVFLKVWPMFDSLRSEPRFRDLMRRVGLPQ
jgi:adenylate cyclase